MDAGVEAQGAVEGMATVLTAKFQLLRERDHQT